MKHITTDDRDLFWNTPADAHVVTTNLTVRNNGTAVMGAGIARSAAIKFPGIEEAYGEHLQKLFGEIRSSTSHKLSHAEAPYIHEANGFTIVCVPTKHHFSKNSTVSLVLRAAANLIDLSIENEWKAVNIPRMGAGLGGLEWDGVVKELLEVSLDDRFTAFHLEN